MREAVQVVLYMDIVKALKAVEATRQLLPNNSLEAEWVLGTTVLEDFLEERILDNIFIC